MTIDRTQIVEYPYSGKFYRTTVDKSGGLKQSSETKSLVLETECDIQEAHSATFVSTTYAIYFPLTSNAECLVRAGDTFEGSMNGLSVNGVVAGVYPSQLGGCLAYLKDFDA